MQHMMKSIGLFICVILSLPLAVSEVEKVTFETDVFWKTIDFEDSNWTQENYDDSWWEDAISWGTPPNGFNAPLIWYPGDWAKNVAYFRKTFEVPGNTIVNGEIKTKTNGDGEIELYINNQSVSRIKIVYEPATIDIKPYIKPGKNVIAAKVTQPKGSPYTTQTYGLTLEGLVRYNTTQ